MSKFINFKTLSFKNFMSYGHESTTIDFDNSMTLITGKNGDGKTTQFIALYYALFGKAYKKTKVGSLINNKNNKELLVSVTFEISEDEFRVVRGQKPAIFEIYKNKELIDQLPSVTGYQEYLDNILQLNENIFKQLVFLGANVNTTKAFTDLTKAEKEELFQTITDTSIFNDLKENIKIKSKEITNQKTELEYKIGVLKEVITTDKKNFEKLEEQNKLITEQNDGIVDELKSKIQETESTIQKYSEALDKIKLKKPLYDEKKNALEDCRLRLSTSKEQLNIYTRQLQRIEDVEKTFTTCIGCEKLHLVSDIDINTKDSIVSSVQEWTDSYKSIDLEYQTLDKEVNDLTDVFVKGKNIKISKDNLSQDLSRYVNELNTIENRQNSVVVIDRTTLEEKEKELMECEDKLLLVKDTLSKYGELNKLFDTNNIKGLIIKQSLPLLNKFINEYLECFSDFNFKFSVDSNFVSSIREYGKIDYEFASLSNGQSMRVSFSIILAFLKLIETRNGVTTNLLVLDEILDSSLDYDGRYELLDIISRNFKEKSVFVISHNTDIISNEYFTKHLSVTNDGYSKLHLKHSENSKE